MSIQTNGFSMRWSGFPTNSCCNSSTSTSQASQAVPKDVFSSTSWTMFPVGKPSEDAFIRATS